VTEKSDQYFEDRANSEEARYHVVPHADEGWGIKREGSEDHEYTASSKSDVVEVAKNRAKDAGTMVIIHDDNGQIEEQHNYES
jgi:Uncharacterized protein conserved in bacteria (DUF2188)